MLPNLSCLVDSIGAEYFKQDIGGGVTRHIFKVTPGNPITPENLTLFRTILYSYSSGRVFNNSGREAALLSRGDNRLQYIYLKTGSRDFVGDWMEVATPADLRIPGGISQIVFD